MISPLRATGIVASGTAVSLAVSVIVGKALALITGPTGVGVYGLMQSVLGVLGIVFGLGIATALVRATAEAVAAGKSDEVDQLRTAAWHTALVTAVAAAIVALLFGQWVAGVLFSNPMLAGAVPLLGLATGIALLSGIESASLNGHHRISVLTQSAIGSSLAGGAGLIAMVAAFGVDGIGPGLLVSAVAGLLVATFAARRAIGPPVIGQLKSSKAATRRLLSVGAPFALSQLAGTGAQLALPIIILYQLNAEAVGFYRAAFTISTGYLAFILNALAQDYYPRVAAAPVDQLRELVERRTRLVLALGVPVILAMLALAPLVLAVLYSSEFEPAAEILQWQLIGDLLKLPAWAMAFAILARGKGRTFLTVELIGGVSLVVGVIVATEIFGLAGAGIGYLVSYAMYYAAVWITARTVAPLVPGRLQVTVVALAILLVVLDVALRDAPFVRGGLLLTGAALMAGLAWPRLWRLHRAGEL